VHGPAGTGRGTRLPASLQLVGPPHAEELLLSTALRIQAAAA
jgi:Asp-tRNA(Asn)/Glu-tRNA(Gln) amidotransferase A subunit family amidase